MNSSNYLPRNRFAEWLGRTAHKIMGWKYTGQLPDIPKYVIIAAHHTSNWDFVVLMAVKLILRIKVRFLAKDTLFRIPVLSWFMKRWGGTPVVRSQSHNIVSQAVSAFRQSDNFILAIAPEGTRGPVKRWKMGFYHIAKQVGVPVMPVAIDFKNREVVIGKPVDLTGDEDADILTLHQFFLPHRPKNPENAWYGPLIRDKNKRTGIVE